jgi:hypothetical protein
VTPRRESAVLMPAMELDFVNRTEELRLLDEHARA